MLCAAPWPSVHMSEKKEGRYRSKKKYEYISYRLTPPVETRLSHQGEHRGRARNQYVNPTNFPSHPHQIISSASSASSSSPPSVLAAGTIGGGIASFPTVTHTPSDRTRSFFPDARGSGTDRGLSSSFSSSLSPPLEFSPSRAADVGNDRTSPVSAMKLVYALSSAGVSRGRGIHLLRVNRRGARRKTWVCIGAAIGTILISPCFMMER
jgi:hypothetical protein